jgi:hypothetical protein
MIVEIDRKNEKIKSVTIGSNKFLETNEIFVPDDWGTEEIEGMLKNNINVTSCNLEGKIKLIDVFDVSIS